MDERIFLLWNGWGLMFTAITGIWQFLHIAVTIKFGSGTPLRKIIAFIPLIAIPLAFIFSGWIVGLLTLPIGIVIGIVLAKVFLRPSRYS